MTCLSRRPCLHPGTDGKGHNNLPDARSTETVRGCAYGAAVDELPNKSTRREVMEKIAEVSVSLIPYVGGPLALVLATTAGWSISRRTDEWLMALAEEVERLGLRLEALADEPAFIDAIVTATRAAQATHQEDKLAALRNGVLHSVGPDAPDLDEQARFFRLVEEFTPGHLHLLSFLNDPEGTYERQGLARPNMSAGSRGALVNELPAFAGRLDWASLLFSDLSNAHLTNAGGLNTMMTAAGCWTPATTPLGQRFLAFIATPQPQEGSASAE